MSEPHEQTLERAIGDAAARLRDGTADLRGSSVTLSVEEAGRWLGVGRSLAYELARRGELPGVLRLGRRLVVSRPALERALGMEPARPADTEPETV